MIGRAIPIALHHLMQHAHSVKKIECFCFEEGIELEARRGRYICQLKLVVDRRATKRD